MAIVVAFERSGIKPKLHPTQVVGHWSVLKIPASDPVFQLDTRGSQDRENPGKQSQTLQFTREAAIELVAILKREFDLP